MTTESTPLLWSMDYRNEEDTHHHRIRTRNDVGDNVHTQFCTLIGCPPSNAPPGYRHKANERLLYGRASHMLKWQNRSYGFSAALSNTLLLTQVVLGAALTGLGASGAPPWLVTAFGATNTIIAGVVAYLKSRGQPMRAKMFRDDLERVIDEIENSEVMWLGISQGVHGYDDIDTDGEVTVRSEVARLTRLFDRAVRNNSMNNPESYMSGQADTNSRAGLRNQNDNQDAGATQIAAVIPDGAVNATTTAAGTAPAPAPVSANDADASPASAKPKPKDESKKSNPSQTDGASDVLKRTTSSTSRKVEDKGKSIEESSAPNPSSSSAPPLDPDAQPATSPKIIRKESSKTEEPPKKVEGEDD